MPGIIQLPGASKAESSIADACRNWMAIKAEKNDCLFRLECAYTYYLYAHSSPAHAETAEVAETAFYLQDGSKSQKTKMAAFLDLSVHVNTIYMHTPACTETVYNKLRLS